MQANLRDKVLISDPKTLEEREKVAREFAQQFKFSLPILVDTIDDQLNNAYSAWPDRIYIVDSAGKIAYKGGPGPRGFDVAEAEEAMIRLLASPAAAPPAPPAPEVILAPPIQRRLQQIMDPLQLTQQQQRAVVEAVALKVIAYRDMAAARRALGASGKTPAEAAAAVEAFQAAASAYQAACRDADAALERRLVLSSLPVLKARLLATGVLGLQFAPPLSPGLGDSPGAPHPPGE